MSAIKCELCTNRNWDVGAKGYKDARDEAQAGKRTIAAVTNRRGRTPATNRRSRSAGCRRAVRDGCRQRGNGQRTAPHRPGAAAHIVDPRSSLEAVQSWKVVWSWQGNNVDGPIAGDNGTMLFANNDAGNVIQFDPWDRAGEGRLRQHQHGGGRRRAARSIRYSPSNPGAGRQHRSNSSRSRTAAGGSWSNGEPLECVGGVIEQISPPTASGGVYFSVTGASNSGVFYASPKGVVSQYRKEVPLANGIILSADEKTLYVTNGAIVYAFDVNVGGSLTNQRQFGMLKGGEGGDGAAVDQQGRLYVATARRSMCLRPTARSSARFRVHRGCTARSSAAGTGRRSSASSSTARGGHQARATRSSRFRPSPKVIRDGRSEAASVLALVA